MLAHEIAATMDIALMEPAIARLGSLDELATTKHVPQIAHTTAIALKESATVSQPSLGSTAASSSVQTCAQTEVCA